LFCIRSNVVWRELVLVGKKTHGEQTCEPVCQNSSTLTVCK
jgi:hypothetical protein